MRIHGVTFPLPQYVFTAWCLIKQWIRLHGVVLKLSLNNFTFTSRRYGTTFRCVCSGNVKSKMYTELAVQWWWNRH